MNFKLKSMVSASGTSFHGQVVEATVTELIAACGSPVGGNNDGKDKVNFEWVLETSTGNVFTIYDWKEYRVLPMNEVIQWHIGAHSKLVAEQALKELESVLRS